MSLFFIKQLYIILFVGTQQEARMAECKQKSIISHVIPFYTKIIYITNFKMLKFLPVIISILALGISFYSWMTNSEPYIVFLWSNERDCYYIKNVGKGPAINIIVTYKNDQENPELTDWKNPVNCYSLESNGKIDIDWRVKEKNKKGGGQLFIKGENYDQDGYYVNGVTSLAAVYSSANFLITRTYTTIFENETHNIRYGNAICKWSYNELFKIWKLERKSGKL